MQRQGTKGKTRAKVIGTTLILVVAGLLIPLLAGAALAGAHSPKSSAADPTCQSAGSTGLTAAVIAGSHDVISGAVNAAGCDIGIYVGPGVTDVVIQGARVMNANDHGILVQDTSDVTIVGNQVVHTGLAPHTCPSPPTGPCIAEDKAIELTGTSGVIVQHNLVRDNYADGGIGISDDGSFNPAGLAAGSLRAGTGNVVAHNQVIDNAFGCGIVVAAYNAGGGVFHNTVRDNVVMGSAPGTGPFVGGIVVAADTPNTVAFGNLVVGNRIHDSLIPGIVVHSNAPGDNVSNTTLLSNVISNNGFEAPPNDPTVPTGIMVVAEAAPGEPNAPVVWNTTIGHDTINQNAIGVWLCSTSNTVIFDLHGHTAVPVESC